MEQPRTEYAGLPRAEIDWFPRIDASLCRAEECGYQCVSFCRYGVFARDGSTVHIVNPYHCNVSDESCRFVCPYDAISFPTRQELKDMLRVVRERHASQQGGE